MRWAVEVPAVMIHIPPFAGLSGSPIACVREHGATYVLYDGKKVYDLNNQQTPEKFAGKRVTITGTLDATNTIQVDSIAPAK